MGGVQPQFLIVDDNRDGRSVIVRAVHRKYPEAVTREFAEFSKTKPVLAQLPPDAGAWVVLAGRAADLEGVALVAAIRGAHARVPIIALGQSADARATLAAGADHFLEYEAWLLVGVMVERVMATWPSAPHQTQGASGAGEGPNVY